VNTASEQVVRRLLAYPSVQKWFAWDVYYVKFGRNWPTPFKSAAFQSVFARSASAVTTSEKTSINTNRKSTTSFSMSLRWTVYVALKLPRGLKNAVSKIWTVICD